MNSVPENQLWVICPTCYQLNPSGTELCKHCWGAAIRQSNPLPYEKAQAISKQKLSELKRREKIKLIKTIVISLVILISAVYPSLYYLTDIISKPPQQMNSNSPAGEWAMFGHDLAHSGIADSSGILPQGKLKWTFSTGGPIYSSPAVAYGTVYIGSKDSKLYALDATTGTKLWEYKADSWIESSPAVVNDIVYFGSNDGKLYALDAHSGKKLWDFQTKYAVMSSPAIANGIVYFGSGDYFLYALDAVKGTKLWICTQAPVISSPTIANGIVYVGSTDFCYALNALNGRRRLRFKSYYPTFSPAVSGETVYFVNSNGYLFAVNGKARNWLQEPEVRPYWMQVWAMGIGVPPPPSPSGLLWELKVGKTVSSSPVVIKDTTYLGSDNKLLAIDLQNRKKLWEFEAGGAISSSPAVANTTIYVGSEDGRLYAIDATSGKKLWDILTGDKITSSPAVASGTLYIGSQDGNLYAIE